MSTKQSQRKTAFTIIELMVVVAIIVLLIAILLPSLQSARQHAKTVQCSSNMHHIGLSMANYLFMSDGTYPASYLYPHNLDGEWSIQTQDDGRPFGYQHWSYFLYEDGKIGDQMFQCPNMERGGGPRTNPGLLLADWEAGQVDQNGTPSPSDLQDKQAPRISYGANAAIIPRNKFNRILSGGERVNVFVKENKVKYSGGTILITEFLNNWKALGLQKGGGIESKAHRPINPFFHVGSGFNEYTASAAAPGFIYGLPADQRMYGILPTMEVREKTNILDHTSGISQLNAVGRHHPTSDAVYAKKYGGAANFLFCDGHAEGMTALQSVEKRKWGDRYYSLSGASEILNMSKVYTAGQ